MLDVLRPVIAAVFTALILWGLARLLGRSAPASLEARSGIIRPELWTAWVTLLTGSLVLSVALWAAIINNGGWAAAAVALLGGAIAGFIFVGTKRELRGRPRCLDQRLDAPAPR